MALVNDKQKGVKKEKKKFFFFFRMEQNKCSLFTTGILAFVRSSSANVVIPNIHILFRPMKSVKCQSQFVLLGQTHDACIRCVVPSF